MGDRFLVLQSGAANPRVRLGPFAWRVSGAYPMQMSTVFLGMFNYLANSATYSQLTR
jgi:hypothetical protein